jgi:hypothetical protein
MRKGSSKALGTRKSTRISTLRGVSNSYSSREPSPEESSLGEEISRLRDREVQLPGIGEEDNLLEGTFQFPYYNPVRSTLEPERVVESELRELEVYLPVTGSQGSPPNLPVQPESGTNTMSRQGARLKYNKFRCDGSQDADEWIKEFEVTLEANQEDPATRLRIFPGLLKGEALLWFDDVDDEVKANWPNLSALFKRTFQDLGGDNGITGRLNKLVQKEGESIRSYGHRMKTLMSKLSYNAPPTMQVEWFVSGLEEDTARYVRRAEPANLRGAMTLAQACEESEKAVRNSNRNKHRVEHKPRRSSRRQRDKTSGSDTDSGTESFDSSDTSPPPRRNSSSRSHRKDGNGPGVKVKVETPDTDKQVMKNLTKAVTELTVQLAAPQKTRRIIPTHRKNVWCSNCGENGHNNGECTKPRPVHYVDAEGAWYYPAEYEEEEPEEAEVYNVDPSYGRGKGPYPFYPPRQPVPGGFQGNTSQHRPMPSIQRQPVSFVRQYGVCFLCGESGHFARDCPARGQFGGSLNQGAPLELPCQNCGENGHTAGQCQEPPKPKVIYKKVDNPPREQTAMNYGHMGGVERPTK